MGLRVRERKLKRQLNNTMSIDISQNYHPLCIGIKYKSTVFLCIHNVICVLYIESKNNLAMVGCGV